MTVLQSLRATMLLVAHSFRSPNTDKQVIISGKSVRVVDLPRVPCPADR